MRRGTITTRFLIWISLVVLVSASLPHLHDEEPLASSAGVQSGFELGRDTAHDEHSPTGHLVDTDCRYCRGRSDGQEASRPAAHAICEYEVARRISSSVATRTNAAPHDRSTARAPPALFV